MPGRKIFQRSFYDRIIRNEKEFYNIQKYIIENSLRWELEKEMPGECRSIPLGESPLKTEWLV